MSFPRMHVSLYVKNIYQTADFYSKFFGQNPDKIKPDYCKFTLNEPSLIISFVQNEENEEIDDPIAQIINTVNRQNRLQQFNQNQNEFDTFAVHRLNKCFKHCHSS